ncbi:MAG: hypothetical protein Q7K55_02140 [Candidatus Levybacteria bacterium]|nr:hypothetical protein [Candidatus Levybacteria bacterium]
MILFARFISLIFNPTVFFLIMPFMVVYRQTQSGAYALKWQIFSFLFLFLGVFLFLIGRLKGAFSDEDVSKREERYRLYIMAYFLAFIYLMVSIFFKGISFPLSIISFGIIIGILIFNLVNYRIKASIHMGVACAFVITTGVLYGWVFSLVTLWIIPLVFWARIISKKHSIREAITGGILGIVITLITGLIGKQLYIH